MLSSRIRTRLVTEFASRDELLACLHHLLAGAGNASLMTPALRHTLCDHAAGNYRILTTMAAELLAAAAQKDLPVLDEKLYIDEWHLLWLPVMTVPLDLSAGMSARHLQPGVGFGPSFSRSRLDASGAMANPALRD